MTSHFEKELSVAWAGIRQSLPANASFDPTGLTDPTAANHLFLRRPDSTARYQQKSVQSSPLAGPVRAAGIGELLSAYTEGSQTPREVVASLVVAVLESPPESRGILRFATGFEAAAEESTQRWADGTARPLEGIPFAIKEIIDVADTVTTAGSCFTGDRIAPADADVVARLRAAGAIPFAMAAASEFAAGAPKNVRYGPVRNPWDSSRWTGGSSTGSGAAVAARIVPMALGTDTAGSIRIPSSWCGITGLKPSRDLVSRKGIAPVSWTLDHVGPMARSARDIAAVLPFMTADADPDLEEGCQRAGQEREITRLRIGIPADWFESKVDGRVLGNWRAALAVLQSLGCELVEMPPLPVETFNQAGWVIFNSELAAFHSARLSHPEYLDPVLSDRLRKGVQTSALDYCRALQLRARAQDMLLGALENVDVMMTPGLGSEAGFLESLTVEIDGRLLDFYEVLPRNTMPFSLTGFPALMLPSGLGSTGLPTGIQIVGRPREDALCLKVGIAFQAATNHHLNGPPGFGKEISEGPRNGQNST